jgi:hypothetical protein
LVLAMVMRASARCALGIPGWRKDFDDAVGLARRTDKFTFCAVVMFKYIATQSWALLPDDDALRDTAEALEIAEQFGDDFTLTNAEFTRGLILVRRGDADRKSGSNCWAGFVEWRSRTETSLLPRGARTSTSQRRRTESVTTTVPLACVEPYLRTRFRVAR